MNHWLDLGLGLSSRTWGGGAGGAVPRGAILATGGLGADPTQIHAGTAALAPGAGVAARRISRPRGLVDAIGLLAAAPSLGADLGGAIAGGGAIFAAPTQVHAAAGALSGAGSVLSLRHARPRGSIAGTSDVAGVRLARPVGPLNAAGAISAAATVTGDSGLDPAAEFTSWWRPSAVGGVSLGTAKGAGNHVTALNDLISTLDLAEGTESQQPGYGAALRQINGRNVLDFDGGDNLSGGFTTDDDLYLAMVAAIDTVDNDTDLLFTASIGFTTQFRIRSNHASQFDGRAEGVFTSFNLTGGPYSDGVARLWEVVLNATAGTVTIHVDGTQVGQATNYTSQGTTTLTLFSSFSQSVSMDAALCEMFLLAGAVPSSELRAALLAYSQSEWGTA
jgi:hypothetical protein